MPRHEIIVERIPQEFQGEPVHTHHHTWTVAEFRSMHATQQSSCLICDARYDISSLESVLDVWGPDAVIHFQLRHHYLPGESPASLGQMREKIRTALSR